MTTPVWISLGSNLGDRRTNLDEALFLLNQTSGVVVTAVSTYHETTPVGGPVKQGLFLNACARLETSLSPHELLAATQAIERQLGRVRTVSWGERTLDLDLLIFGSLDVDEEVLKLPHPRLAVRRFVLEPLAEIAQEVVEPVTHQSIAELLKNLDRRPRIVMLDQTLVDRFPQIHHQLAILLSGASVEVNYPDDRSGSGPFRLYSGKDPRIRLNRTATPRSSLSDSTPWGEGWLVCKFAMDIPPFRSANRLLPQLDFDPSLVTQSQVERSKLWSDSGTSNQLRTLSKPTLIFALPGPISSRHPGMARTPIYRAVATEFDAILSEAAALCHSIAAV